MLLALRRVALARHSRRADRGLAEGVVGDRERHGVLALAAGVVVAAHLRLVLEAARRCGAIHAHEELLRRELPGQDGLVDQEGACLHRDLVLEDLELQRFLLRSVFCDAGDPGVFRADADELRSALEDEPADEDDDREGAGAGKKLLHGNSGTRRGERVIGNDCVGSARIGHDQLIMNSAGRAGSVVAPRPRRHAEADSATCATVWRGVMVSPHSDVSSFGSAQAVVPAAAMVTALRRSA